MTGDCREIRCLLDLYVAGSLAAEKRAVVETHVSECAACRKELAFSRVLCSIATMKERREEGYHPSTKILSELAFAPDLLVPGVRKSALEHIATCTRCRDEYETVNAVARESEMEEDAVSGGLIWAGIKVIAASLTVRRVPAWVAVACAALALLVILRDGIFTRRMHYGMEPFTISGGVEFDSAPDFSQARPMRLRAGQQPDIFPDVTISEVILQSSETRADIVVERPHMLAGAQYVNIDLYRLTDGGPALSASWAGIRLPDSSGPVSLPIPIAVLQEGMYLLVLKPSIGDRDQDQPAVLFRIRVSILPD